MEKESLLMIIRLVAESRAKEGDSFDEESCFSNLEPMLKALSPAKRPSPTERTEAATARHIEDACAERDRMARELAEAREDHSRALRELRRDLESVIETGHTRLAWLEPHYEGLKRDYDNIRSLNFSAFFMITVGSVVIGS